MRAYSPIIEEKESRPASTDPIEDRKPDDNISIRSRSMSAASIPSGTSAQDSKEINTADDSKKETEATPEEVPTNESISDDKTQPIFKPLHTDKGKSKTTGKSIGGWI